MHNHHNNLFVYADNTFAGEAIGLRGTDSSRFETSGGTTKTWLRVRGDTIRLRRPALYSYRLWEILPCITETSIWTDSDA
jgi:hypothetical protein